MRTGTAARWPTCGSRREDGLSLFNLEAVAGGYAEELQYGPRPGAWQAELRAAEAKAVAAGLGRWGACQERPRS